MWDAIIKAAEKRQKDATEAIEALFKTAESEKRDLTDTEDAQVTEHLAKRDKATSDLKEARASKAAEDAYVATEVRDTKPAEVGTTVKVASEPNPVYRNGDASTSFFRDLFMARTQGDVEAGQRLARSQETRALSTGAGVGGEFAPPLWLVDEFVKLARAGRVTADLVHNEVLPEGVSSINLPKVSTGTSTAIQSSQNTALSQTDLATSSVTGTIQTVGGKQIVSIQLLKQSGVPFDRVILDDLSRSYANQVGQIVVSAISGLSGANAGTVSATTATGAGSIFSQSANGIQLIQTNRFASPDTIIMHPRRWAALLGATDTAGRPLVVPNGMSFNQLATGDAGAPQQTQVGTMLGLPVYTDPNVPTNKGAGTNQDEVYIFCRNDLWLYESAMQTASFEATYADQASVLFRVLGFLSFIPNRYPKAVAVLGGAGLVPPSF